MVIPIKIFNKWNNILDKEISKYSTNRDEVHYMVNILKQNIFLPIIEKIRKDIYI